MRLLVASAVVAAFVLAGFNLGATEDSRISSPPIAGASHVSLDQAASITKQAERGKPEGRPTGDDSCRWANDNECDDPDIGTGACRLGTDYSDCRRLRAGRDDDTCRWANDGECDEPHLGTGACVQGSDRTDCGDIAWMRNQNDGCATSFNGVCEEAAGGGNGACAARTDRSDCHGRERPMRINDHFLGRDDRVRVNAQQAPWRFMGRFTNAEGEACTATLIARDVLATAAHCIHTDTGVTRSGDFVPEAGGEGARAVAYLVSPRFNYRRFNSGNELDGYDWALIRLNRPIGDRLGFAGVRNLAGTGIAAARSADLYQAGYSWDTGDTLSANIACHMAQTFPDNTFSHECDTTQGDSGSGILVRNGQGYDLIGVDSNYRENPDGPLINIAVGAAAFQPVLADFIAGRSGTPFGSQSGGRRK